MPITYTIKQSVLNRNFDWNNETILRLNFKIPRLAVATIADNVRLYDKQ